MNLSASSIDFAHHAAAPAPASVSITGILAGLRRRPKELSSIYFYDARGSELFEQICALPDYYLTRTETGILAQHAEQIAALLGANALLVEIGSGASIKTQLLLDRLEHPAGYVPVDISAEHLGGAVQRLRSRYPRLPVVPLCMDFTVPLPTPISSAARTAVFFPGSTIGNFALPEAVPLLARLREFAGRHAALIIGVDLVKDVARLQRAYDDPEGITAAFNLNMLAHLNRVFGSDFDLAGFAHAAPWVSAAQRIEMHLISRRAQQVRIGGEVIHFSAGERLRTEICHKYTLPGFAQLAQQAGWEVIQVWTDPQAQFSIQYAEGAKRR